MSDEEIFNTFQKLESIIGRGLDDSIGAVGLTRKDTEQITCLRDSAVFALSIIKCNKAKFVKEEVKENA